MLVPSSRLPRSRSRYNGHWSSEGCCRSWDLHPKQRSSRSRALATDLFPLCYFGGLGTRQQDLVSRSRLKQTSFSDKGYPIRSWCSVLPSWPGQNFFLDRYPMMSYGQTNKGENMAIDFDALDLVRGENKSRSYNKRIDELARQVASLQELAQQMVKELPDEKKWSFEERLKKIKERS